MHPALRKPPPAPRAAGERGLALVERIPQARFLQLQLATDGSRSLPDPLGALLCQKDASATRPSLHAKRSRLTRLMRWPYGLTRTGDGIAAKVLIRGVGVTHGLVRTWETGSRDVAK